MVGIDVRDQIRVETCVEVDSRTEVTEMGVPDGGVPEADVPGAEARLVAAFAGAPAPPAPLTWGQRALWIAMRRRGPEEFRINISKIVPVPEGATDDVPGVLSAVAALVGRHSSLRTRIEDGDGEAQQVVSASGELPVLLHPGDVDGRATARAVATRLSATPFDHAHEWPQRVALILEGERVGHIVFVFSHTTIDLWAAEMVLAELRLLLRGGELENGPGPQSVDIARLEHGADRRHSERAVNHWVRGFGRLPHQTLPRIGPPLVPRFQRWLLVSDAADTATFWD